MNHLIVPSLCLHAEQEDVDQTLELDFKHEPAAGRASDPVTCLQLFLSEQSLVWFAPRGAGQQPGCHFLMSFDKEGCSVGGEDAA